MSKSDFVRTISMVQTGDEERDAMGFFVAAVEALALTPEQARRVALYLADRYGAQIVREVTE